MGERSLIKTVARREEARTNRKIRLRKFVGIFTVLFGLLLISTVSGLGRLLLEKVVFYEHIVWLYTEKPDVRLLMPLPDISKRQVANTWHAPRGTDRLHEGQDIFALKGTPVYSATAGFVYKVGENNLGGQTVSVIGGGGRVYYYAHLDSYAPGISEGDRVTTKTLLGYVGTTGNAQGTPPHLHFGVYTTSGAINPLPLIVDRPNSTLSNIKSQSKPALTSRAPVGFHYFGY